MLDNFREWLSDNLRYILLGLAILAVHCCCYFFGIKTANGNSSDKRKWTKKTEQKKESTDSKNR